MAETTSKMICEIINPSDPYTLLTDDFTLAAVAVGLLGQGKFGLSGPDGQSTPILFGWDAWFEANGIPDLGAYIEANALRLADVLDTVVIGPKAQRADAEAMLAMLDADKRAEWLAARHDWRRTSMSDIGGAAVALAERLRDRAALTA